MHLISLMILIIKHYSLKGAFSPVLYVFCVCVRVHAKMKKRDRLRRQWQILL